MKLQAKNLIEQYKIPEKFALLAPIARGKHQGKAKHWEHFNELVAPLRAKGVEPIVFSFFERGSLSKGGLPRRNYLAAHHSGKLCSHCETGSGRCRQ